MAPTKLATEPIAAARPSPWPLTTVRHELVRWSADDRSLLDGLSTGDRVALPWDRAALPWDWISDVLTEEPASSITSREARSRAALAESRS